MKAGHFRVIQPAEWTPSFILIDYQLFIIDPPMGKIFFPEAGYFSRIGVLINKHSQKTLHNEKTFVCISDRRLCSLQQRRFH
jgi:hypothetical protein